MLAGILLVGGKSKRYGTNKALEKIEGRTFFERVYDELDKVVEKVLVSISDSTPPSIVTMARMKNAEIVQDEPLPCGGPPRAVVSAARSSNYSKYVIIAVDYPLVTSQVIKNLYDQSRSSRLSALTPVLYKGYPLVSFGVVSKGAIESLEKVCYIKQSKTRLSDLYRIAFFTGYYGWRNLSKDPRVFLNVNKPEDLGREITLNELADMEKIHVRDPHYAKAISCIGDNDLECALNELKEELEVYESKGLRLLALHVRRDLDWFSSQYVYD